MSKRTYNMAPDERIFTCPDCKRGILRRVHINNGSRVRQEVWYCPLAIGQAIPTRIQVGTHFMPAGDPHKSVRYYTLSELLVPTKIGA